MKARENANSIWLCRKSDFLSSFFESHSREHVDVLENTLSEDGTCEAQT